MEILMIKVKNNLSCIALLSLLSASAYALPFDGFYAGGAIGGSQSEVNINQSVEVNPALDDTSILDVVQKNNGHMTDNAWLGDLNLGFGHAFSQTLYLGIEGDVAFQNLQVSKTSSTLNQNPNSPLALVGKTKVDLTNQFSLVFMPGIVLQQTTLLYGKVGPAWGDFDVKGSASYNHTINPPITLTGGNQFSNDGYQTGLLLALGIEHYVAQNVSIKLEYDHVNYGTLHGSSPIVSNISSNDPVNVPITGPISNVDKISASTNSVMFGVTYHFA